MKDNNLLFDLDDEAIEKLAQEFPVLTDEEKERMYAMSERKYNITEDTNTGFNSETEVSGVERYKRPKWRTASIAASLALLIGAGSFGGYNIAKQFSNGDNNDPDVPTTVSEDMSQALTEVSEDPRTEEYRQTAEGLLAEYEDFLEPFDYDIMPKYPDEDMESEELGKMSEEEYNAYLDKIDEERQRIDEEAGQSFDYLYYELGNGDPLDYPNYTFLGHWEYQHYEIGMKFSNTDEVMDKALSFMSQSLIHKQFPDLIGEELTNYEKVYTFRQDIEQCPDFGTYAMYNGKLYCNALDRDTFNSQKIPSTYRFYNCQNEPIVITDIEDSSFTATVKYEFTNVPNKYDMSMKVVNRDGKWIIDDIEPTGPELDAQKLDIVDKMMNSVKLYDKISANNAHFEKIPENSSDEDMDYSVSYRILCADNRAARSYDYVYDGDGYKGSEDITSMTEYAKKNIDPEHEKENEVYCDGEKFYYWHNPTDLDRDESNGKEYRGYDWNNYFYRDSNADKYKGFEAIRLNSTHDVSYDSPIYKGALCPDGEALVINYLYDFSTWNITGDINFEGRDCYIIEGKRPKKDYDEYERDRYLLYIDKETGIPMLDISYLENGDISSVDLYFDVKLNDKAEPVPEKDMSWFDTSLENYK
ncbi:hypothetical protein [Ruminococcus flavefaciens]|uniref:hypothetical protein n=1 Tax=Ruminococcus flavefaciens TaxID=1265 RepID=UPI0026EFFB3F|nr:hypothetical protein [Ruminococcus flavefaciens]